MHLKNKFAFPSRLPLWQQLKLAYNHWRTFRHGYPSPWGDDKLVGYRGPRRQRHPIPHPGLVRILWDTFWNWSQDVQRPTFQIWRGGFTGGPFGPYQLTGDRKEQWDNSVAILDKMMAAHMAKQCTRADGKHAHLNDRGFSCPISNKTGEKS